MFYRRKKNKSGSVSIQIISKHQGIYKVKKTIGCAFDEQEIVVLEHQARHEILRLQKQPSLFVNQDDALLEGFLKLLSNADILVAGPEMVFGRIYDSIGYNAIKEDLFRHLVISRLAYPGSKLKTIDYLQRYSGVYLQVDAIYRFLDRLHHKLKEQLEQITYRHTVKLLDGKPGVVFYDMTTLHFEASDEDDLRKTGFSKTGKHQEPQIYLGLLVTTNGYPIGYEVFEGNTFEAHTLIPVIEKFEKKFNFSKPIIIADAGLITAKNIQQLEASGYQYILGARIKNESAFIKNKILSLQLKDGEHAQIKKSNTQRLIIQFTQNRSAKDRNNRQRGLSRLEKQIKGGRLTKSHINNKGYNKYLKMTGNVAIEIDYEKFKQDEQWDGLKGYNTNCRLSAKQIIENYNQLWQIEKAFRISKTDLKVRPIYHRIRHRIDAHISIAFTAYAIYKEIERVLQKENSKISAIRAAELTHTIYQLMVTLPQSRVRKSILPKLDKEQQALLQVINKNF